MEDHFTIIEMYHDQSAIEAHRISDHFRALFPRILDLLVEPPMIEYVNVSNGGLSAAFG
ncbi:MAG: hypothetical protein QHC67_12410 [Sphingobium sp.]|uniref:putative quinol monooxygenase n=1 Tax=Sphingobium sp. TaxID=1912891 RepID=UPI0029A0B5C4|nr:antibiotic biosynthesis monooxygenase [Sphingobium sp.]MDX3910604.1 hypothetical protein [Sphingobium sp.]